MFKIQWFAQFIYNGWQKTVVQALHHAWHILNPVLIISSVLSVVGTITLHVGLDIGITMSDDMNVTLYARLLHNLHKVESLLI